MSIMILGPGNFPGHWSLFSLFFCLQRARLVTNEEYHIFQLLSPLKPIYFCSERDFFLLRNLDVLECFDEMHVEEDEEFGRLVKAIKILAIDPLDTGISRSDRRWVWFT
jgi:hypothetical protein